MTKLAPIVLFTYNRLNHTKKTVTALQKNDLAKDSRLYIFSDGPKTDKDILIVKQLRKFLHTIRGFKKVEIVESKGNKGLANSVISGVTQVINIHGKVIVLEDDIVTSPVFLKYMNELLEKYKNKENIFSVTGFNVRNISFKDYPYSVYFNPRAASWSWGTWKDKWDKVDWNVRDYETFMNNKKLQDEFEETGTDKVQMLSDQKRGLVDSWAIRWDYTHFKHNAFCVYPTRSYVRNIGLDGSGIHSSREKVILVKLNVSKTLDIPDVVEKNPLFIEKFAENYYIPYYKRFIYKLFTNKQIKFYKKIKQLLTK